MNKRTASRHILDRRAICCTITFGERLFRGRLPYSLVLVLHGCDFVEGGHDIGVFSHVQMVQDDDEDDANEIELEVDVHEHLI